jgi:hypothetical protein
VQSFFHRVNTRTRRHRCRVSAGLLHIVTSWLQVVSAGAILASVTPVSAHVIESSPIDTPKENTRLALEQILASRTFERAPTLRRLLEYLWERRGEEVSEYAIATEALKRRADFDPRYDATVRVLVSRLRQRLKVFYEEEGTALTERILIPLGTHQIQVVETEPNPRAELHSPVEGRSETNEPRPWWLSRNLIAAQSAVILILAVTSGWLLWGRSHAAIQTARADPAQWQLFWKQFFDNGRSTHIIVPNPIFFAFKKGLMVRDVHVNDYLALNSSVPLKSLRNQFGPPTLWQDYVSASDAFSMLRLDRFLETQGVTVAISTTAEISPEALDHENVIIAGNSHTLAPFPDILNQLNFQVDTDHMRAINRHPLPGEPEQIDTVEESPTRIVTPGVIASLPGGPAGTHILLLMATYHTAALVEYLTSQSGMRELEQAQAAHGNCRYFEAVILSQIEGNTELRSRLRLFRPYKPR